MPGRGAGRKQVHIRMVPAEEPDEVEEEEWEEVGSGRRARWTRIAQAAVKQSLRYKALDPHMPYLLWSEQVSG